MAQIRKYTNLPDLDTSPDIYESQENAATATSHTPESPTSPYESEPSSDSEAATVSADQDDPDISRKESRISHRGVSASRARSQFAGSRVDARGVDFSDRITNGRKSYRVPLGQKSRKRRVKRGEDGYVDEYDFDSEDEETFEEKIARLKREIEEVKAEGEKRINGAVNGEGRGQATHTAMSELSDMLDNLQSQTRASQPRRGPEQTRLNGAAQSSSASTLKPHQEISTPDLDRILSKATAFESRLTALENSLGLPSLSSINVSQPPPPSNVFTTLSKLDSQMTTLNAATLPSLDNMSAQISSLTMSAKRLAESRTAARQAQEALLKSPGGTPRPSFPSSATARTARTVSGEANSPSSQQVQMTDVDPETANKINDLHKSLSNIAALSPLLPSVLDRLKSLRVLHADAATVSERFGEAERLQAKLGAEIERWRDALEKLEGRVDEAAKVEEGNKDTVQGWMRKLEKRVEALDDE